MEPSKTVSSQSQGQRIITLGLQALQRQRADDVRRGGIPRQDQRTINLSALCEPVLDVAGLYRGDGTAVGRALSEGIVPDGGNAEGEEADYVSVCEAAGLDVVDDTMSDAERKALDAKCAAPVEARCKLERPTASDAMSESEQRSRVRRAVLGSGIPDPGPSMHTHMSAYELMVVYLRIAYTAVLAISVLFRWY